MDKLEVSLNFNNLTDDERNILLTLIEKATLTTATNGKGLIGNTVKAGVKVRIINVEPHRNDKYVCLDEYIGKTGSFYSDIKFSSDRFESSLMFDDEYMNAIDRQNGGLCWRYDEIEVIE